MNIVEHCRLAFFVRDNPKIRESGLEITYMGLGAARTERLKVDTLPEAISQLGLDGWELVAISPGKGQVVNSPEASEYHGDEYYFKRVAE